MKITIAGYGVEGISNLRYFQGKYPDAEFTVADARSIEELAASTPTGVALAIKSDNSESENNDCISCYDDQMRKNLTEITA